MSKVKIKGTTNKKEIARIKNNCFLYEGDKITTVKVFKVSLLTVKFKEFRSASVRFCLIWNKKSVVKQTFKCQSYLNDLRLIWAWKQFLKLLFEVSNHFLYSTLSWFFFFCFDSREVFFCQIHFPLTEKSILLLHSSVQYGIVRQKERKKTITWFGFYFKLIRKY